MVPTTEFSTESVSLKILIFQLTLIFSSQLFLFINFVGLYNQFELSYFFFDQF